MNKQDPFAASYKRRRRQRHVLLCGEVHRDSFAYFLREFFHPERRMDIGKVVVLCPWEPDPDTAALLMNPQYETRVQWLRGSAMSDADLHRAHVEDAVACFVMVDKKNKDTEETDSLASLITMSLGHWNSDMPIYAQVASLMIITGILCCSLVYVRWSLVGVHNSHFPTCFCVAVPSYVDHLVFAFSALASGRGTCRCMCGRD
jgi:hypothetical protein